MAGYWKRENFLAPTSVSSPVSATLKVSASSRNRRFSVGTKPDRKMLIPCSADA